eukprot:6194640-Pleurochrysis_carterae.AAC.2
MEIRAFDEAQLTAMETQRLARKHSYREDIEIQARADRTKSPVRSCACRHYVWTPNSSFDQTSASSARGLTACAQWLLLPVVFTHTRSSCSFVLYRTVLVVRECAHAHN